MIGLAMIVNGLEKLGMLRGRTTGPAFGSLSGIYRAISERRQLARLARLSPHLLCDMGFDPEEVRAALGGELRVSEPFRRRQMRRDAEAGELRAGRGSVPYVASPRAPRPAPRMRTATGECC